MEGILENAYFTYCFLDLLQECTYTNIYRMYVPGLGEAIGQVACHAKGYWIDSGQGHY